MAVSVAKERFHLEPYELSQDLIAKQLEVLEKKYGGSHRAKKAALTIQRAFRRSSMEKKFQLITAQKRSEFNPRLIKYRKECQRLDEALQLEYKCTCTKNQFASNEYPTKRAITKTVSFPTPNTNRLKGSHIKGNINIDNVLNPSHTHNIRNGHYIQKPTIIDSRQPFSHEPKLYSDELDTSNNFESEKSGLSYCVRKLNSTCNPSIANQRSISHISKKIEKLPIAVPLHRSQSAAINHKHPKNAKYNTIPPNTKPSENMPNESYKYAIENCMNVENPNSIPKDVPKPEEMIRKRRYRIGLNIFNKKPEKGISYLINRGFLQGMPHAVARFLIRKTGLSKQMIGEYLGNISHPFNMAVLKCFTNGVDLSKMPVDEALRKFQSYFRFPGEAQKIEQLVKVFSYRYCECNPIEASKLHSSETFFVLSFAIMMLHTDLHTPSLKAEKRMKLEDFVRNLRNIDDGHDLDQEMLSGIYERIKSSEFRPGSDHVTQVMKVQQTIVAKCPNLALPHRRLVCYCRLYEVNDPNKKERPGFFRSSLDFDLRNNGSLTPRSAATFLSRTRLIDNFEGLHQREVFLFNDILVITKIHSRKKNTVTYSFRQSYLLAGLSVTTFETQHYPFGIKVTQKWDRKLVLTLNARNEHDRTKFVEDMKESIAEMDEMETLRLESELEKQRLSVVSTASTTSNATNINNNNSKSSNDLHIVNRDSGITGDSLSSEGNNELILRHQTQGSSSGHGSMLLGNSNHQSQSNGSAVVLRKSAINNSLLDLTDASEKMARRGSVGSLDSGMSISFVQSGATPSSSNTHTHRHSGDGQSNHHSHHHQQHTSRALGNGANMIHPVVGTCKNCMNPVAMPLGGNNHSNACYHHLHHHHYHHHNHHLQPDYQHRHHNISVRQTELNSSNGSSGNSHSSNTVASITSAML